MPASVCELSVKPTVSIYFPYSSDTGAMVSWNLEDIVSSMFSLLVTGLP